ncbi:Cytochrome P450 [Streptoalloteichus tenebrarius]|uniref:Cytochrome P450 n=1 Tax=Streptoalloteichus tenebrarius (strain ATCC 17920 / DSM 40477 / JCM 4838 / CBS 697.72 / NBRC 16177 / NCIMB 11028 / NRRL B-12390 / A12253. 1 / ISP 5477) TaxID=1933 RepID=A0ABT1HNL0_STRSD|nr:cytochrome P450 [Streptoalloteichus tenebrarius]MCP2257075.1 Cytochrome P450 [Streptoalloteichus tenebrarius]BFE98706.1 cytochrome P450 [Streptoalloteichus tenebrarius]
MTTAPRAGIDPFATTVRPPTPPRPLHAALRATGPVVRVDAPAGGPAWIVTDDTLARKVLTDPRVSKDPACAPHGWNPHTAGLEPRADERLSLTTLDGQAHAELRRAHAPLFSARRLGQFSEDITATARELLTALAATGDTVDLMADFTTRFPLTVLCDLLGVPRQHVDAAMAASRLMITDDVDQRTTAVAAFMDLAATALREGRHGLAAELRDRLPTHVTEDQLRYLIFALLFAGQLTTDASLGFLIARALGDDQAAVAGAADEVVEETLRLHPPAPFTLWRFTTSEIELAGTRIPAHAPILVDIQGINTDPHRPRAQDLTFGAGPHYCIGAHLAQMELRVVLEVLRADFPHARLAVPFAELRQIDFGGIQGSRLIALPVRLRG